MNYNKYNQEYSDQINKLYRTFKYNDYNSYLKLLKLIYNIYFCENIFIIIDNNIKYQLNQTITLILNNNNINSKDEFNLISEINNLINYNNNYMINYSLKQKIENILINANYLTEQEILKNKNVFHYVGEFFDNKNIINFFQKFQIDFKSNVLSINNVKIPNFSLYHKNPMIDHHYEFFHLLFKIYGPLLFYGHSFYEGYEYQISDKDIVFDCGGNMGLFALYCASRGATVYCFEPMSYIRDFLEISKSIYPDKIKIIPYGVSDFNHEVSFYQTFNPGASMQINLNLDTSPEIYKEKCKLITLDDFCEQFNIKPTFIKADIEGSESQMLNGAKQILKNYKPVLNICLNHKINDQYTIPSLIYSLNENYSFYYFIEGVTQSKFVLCK